MRRSRHCLPSDMPRWRDLDPAERRAFGNGLGPWWFPAWLRRLATSLSLAFFHEADWAHHDYGYARGGSESDRARADRLFLAAMLRDGSRLNTVTRMAGASLLAWLFWALVRLFGWTAFNYRRER